MADPAVGSTVEMNFNTLAAGWGPLEPRRSMVPGSDPLYRNMNSMYPIDGYLQGRPRGVKVLLSGGGVSFGWPPTTPQITPAAARQFIPFESVADHLGALVTTRSIFGVSSNSAYVGGGGNGWADLTPVYTTGTVSINTGTTSLTGVGTLWQTRHIYGGQVLLSGAWYNIATVNTDTSITLASNYLGGNIAGAAYTIRRNFANLDAVSYPRQNVFGVVFNGDLYVGFNETGLGYPGQGSNQLLCGVIKCAGIAVPGHAALTGTYQMANFDLTGTMVAGSSVCTNIEEIVGMDLLEDGRIILACTDAVLGNAVIYYSSHLNTTVWTVSPGGFNPITSQHGRCNGLGKFAGAYTLHFDAGVSLAYPTGQDDPPLQYRRAANANVGAVSSQVLAVTPIGEMFLSRDGCIYSFDGQSTKLITSAPSFDLKQKSFQNMANGNCSALYRTLRNEYWLFYSPETDISNTAGYCVNLNTGSVSRHRFFGAPTCGNGLSAMSQKFDFLTLAQPRQFYIGTKNQVIGGGVVDMLYLLDEEQTQDDSQLVNWGTVPGACSVDTDDLDFGAPGMDKSPTYAILWATGRTAGSESITIQASRDGGASWELTTGAVSLALTTTEERPYYFYFATGTAAAPALAAEHWRFRISGPSDSSLNSRFTKMRLAAAVTGTTQVVPR